MRPVETPVGTLSESGNCVAHQSASRTASDSFSAGPQPNTRLALLRGLAAVTLKSAALLFVSVQPPSPRSAAAVADSVPAEVVPVAEPSEQLVVPYATKSTTLVASGHAAAAIVVVPLISAILPAPAPILIVVLL